MTAPRQNDPQAERYPTNYLFIKKSRRGYLPWLVATMVVALAGAGAIFWLLRR
ncbi:MAG: hypothetical protein HY903_16745 [Deltaproteobacteria bacterium]|nr:hypothetical protein [Deltaproteobacteria bacterium]